MANLSIFENYMADFYLIDNLHDINDIFVNITWHFDK